MIGEIKYRNSLVIRFIEGVNYEFELYLKEVFLDRGGWFYFNLN